MFGGAILFHIVSACAGAFLALPPLSALSGLDCISGGRLAGAKLDCALEEYIFQLVHTIFLPVNTGCQCTNLRLDGCNVITGITFLRGLRLRPISFGFTFTFCIEICLPCT